MKAECKDPAATFFAARKTLSSKEIRTGVHILSNPPVPRAPDSPAPHDRISPVSKLY